MSFAALRASARRVNVAASAGRLPRTALRNPAFRKYSTEAPKKSSNAALIGAVGVAALGGAAFWVYASSSDSAKEAGTAFKSGAQAAKVAANFVPTKEDYQKVLLLVAPPFAPPYSSSSVFRCTTVLRRFSTLLPTRNMMVRRPLHPRRPLGAHRTYAFAQRDRWFLRPRPRPPCVARIGHVR